MNSRLAVLTLLGLFAPAVFGQDSASLRSGPGGFSGSSHFSAPPFGMTAIDGAPYSAEEVVESVQTLADGTHITQTMATTKVYRDSLGRTRTERPLLRGPIGMRPNAPSPELTLVEIRDPVAQAWYVLDVQNKVAHRQALPAPGPRSVRSRVATAAAGPMRPNAAGQTTGVAGPRTTTEKLGAQMIEGVLAEGTRHTATVPVGAQGNDRPITSTTELWMSPELKVMVLSKSTDPRSGEHTQKLIHLSRDEPDAGLFQLPPDYTVVEEKGDFTVQWGSQQQ